MNKIPLYKLDLDLYYEKLDNGLEVYMIPNSKVNNIYATYSTKYGSIHNEFIPVGEKKMIKVPGGIAHFLEHKVFEQKDGLDVFDFYGERGADINANTSNFKTTYLFSGPDFFDENLDFLMDFVQQPYFTDENVKKEQGIIEQEIKMGDDHPYGKLYEGIYYNVFIKHPIKYPVIGTIKSVNSITKEDLYKCYHTFYHPSNMFVVVTGNINPEETLEIIKKNQHKRNIKAVAPIKIKEYDEPDKVSKTKEVIEMNVTIPKAAIAFKINISNMKDLEISKRISYINYLFNLKLGATSLLNEELRTSEVIADYIGTYHVRVDNHMVVFVATDTKDAKKFFKKVIETLKELSISEKEVNRFKKVMTSSFISATDNIFKMNRYIMSDIISFGKVDTEIVRVIEDTKIEDFEYIIKNIDLSNYTTFVINPLK